MVLKEIKCPSCKQVTVLSTSNVDHLPTNFLVKRMAEQKNESLAKGKEKEKVALCKEHARKLDLFCNDARCMKLVCEVCVAHKSHSYFSIDKAVQFYGGMLFEKVQSAFEKINTSTEHLDDCLNNLQRDKLIAEENVKSVMNQVRELVIKREQFLLGQINTNTTELHSLLSSQRKNLIEAKQPITQIEKQITENYLKGNHTSQLSLLENIPHYFQQIDQVLNFNLVDNNDNNNSNKPSPFLSFEQIEIKEILQDLIENFGKITTNPPRFNKLSFPQPLSIPSTRLSTPASITIQQPQPCDYINFLLNRGKKSKRILGPKLEGVLKLKAPGCISIISKDWFSNSYNNNIQSSSSSTQQITKEPFSSDDLLVISDSGNNRVILIEKTSGKVKSTIGKQGNQLGELDWPLGTAVTKSSTHPNVILLVVDYQNLRVQAFDIETGKYLSHFIHEKYLKQPSSIIVNQSNHNILIANEGTDCVSIHHGFPSNSKNKFGTIIKVIGEKDGIKFSSPHALAINSRGHLIVSSNHQIDIFDSDYIRVKSFGSYGKKDGQFNVPLGVCVDPFDNILVCESEKHRAQIFDSEGNWIGSFGKHGNGDGCFISPTNILVDHENGDVLVLDYGNCRVMFF